MKNNKGLTIIELVIALTIIATIVGIIVPSYIRYVEKAKRVADVHTAIEIKNAYEHIIALYDPGTSVASSTYTHAVMWAPDSSMPDPNKTNLTLSQQVFLELGEVPKSKTYKDYFWIVEYDGLNGFVNKISITSAPNSSVRYELYPNSNAFLKGQ